MTILISGTVCAADSIVEVIELQNRPATEIVPLLQPLLSNGDQAIENGFNLLLKTEPNRLANLRSLISKLDIRQHNLLISVLQHSTKSAAELNSEASIAITAGAIEMQGYNADTRNLSSNRSLQQLRTLEGQPAHIETGLQRQVENAAIYNNGYGYPVVGYTTQQQQATTGFAVIPRLSASQEVLIEIEPWSDHFLRGSGSGSAIEIQNANTSIRAQLGEWVEIAGTGNGVQTESNGFKGMNHQSRSNETHTLLKVELAD
jgi:type II secretory pathway component GspD/PulD (secretin)